MWHDGAGTPDNIAVLEGTQVGAILEPDPEMMRAAPAIAPGARMAPSLQDLLAVEALDCLVIASPNHLHVDQIAQIAEARPLSLLVEKPQFTNPDDAARLAWIERSYPCPVWVAMEYRYMLPIVEAQDTSGRVKILSIRENCFPFLEKVGNWNRFNRDTDGTFAVLSST